MNVAVVVGAYLAALALVALAAFALVILVAGPHAGLLPHWMEAAALALGWLAVLIVPFLVARAVRHRLGRARNE